MRQIRKCGRTGAGVIFSAGDARGHRPQMNRVIRPFLLEAYDTHRQESTSPEIATVEPETTLRLISPYFYETARHAIVTPVGPNDCVS